MPLIFCTRLSKKWDLRVLYANHLSLFWRWEVATISISNVQTTALTFAEELFHRSAGDLFSVEVRSSIKLLTIDEAAAMCAYTSENGPYRALNRLLREENNQFLQSFTDYLWLLMHGLKKCPGPKVPLVYRGIRRGAHEGYKVGSIVTWCSFSSCTTRLEALENREFVGVSGERTEFHITLTTNRARSIGHLSVMPEEDEILLPPNTRLLVMVNQIEATGYGWCSS